MLFIVLDERPTSPLNLSAELLLMKSCFASPDVKQTDFLLQNLIPLGLFTNVLQSSQFNDFVVLEKKKLENEKCSYLLRLS